MSSLANDWPDGERRTAALDRVLVRTFTDEPLTRRELDVLRCYAVGMRRPMIAEALGITTETVRKHARDARRKLGGRNLAHAVAIAMRAGTL